MMLFDGDPASAPQQDPKHISASAPKEWVKMQRIRRRRLQLAAALIEADNADIDRRIEFVARHDPKATDLLAHLTKLVKHAKNSVIFREFSIKEHEHERPVYTYRLSTQRELSREYLNLQQENDMPDESQSQEDSDQSATRSEAEKSECDKISLSLDLFGSPILNVLQQTQSIELAAQAYAEQEQKRAAEPSSEVKENRSQRLLERIQKLNVAVHSSPAHDISFSSSENTSMSQEESQVSRRSIIPQICEAEDSMDALPEKDALISAADTDGLGIHAPPSRPDLQSFRERVMNRKSQAEITSEPEIVPAEPLPSREETETSLVPLQKPPHGSEMSTKQLNSMAHGTALDDAHIPPSFDKKEADVYRSLAKLSAQGTDAALGKKEKPSKLLIPAISRRVYEITRTPILDDLSPVPDIHDPTIPPLIDHVAPNEAEMMGVSLQSPAIPSSRSPLGSIEEPPPTSSTLKPCIPSSLSLTEAHSSYMTYVDDPSPSNQTSLTERDAQVRRRHSWLPSYVCVPPPLQELPVKTPGDTFYVPRGAFSFRHGVVVPTLSSKGDAYGPIQVPLGMGRRVLYPSTALFRNVLVTRDYEQEGWGWDRYTSSAKYFDGINADDDDSDDELPLMDVRIHHRESYLMQKRMSRERRRQRRARLERRRLRALAREKGKPASVYGVTEESTEGEFSDTASDDGFSSDETDPELPWVDDLRPAGKLYGKSLMGTAEAEKKQRESEIRFYGQVMAEEAQGQHPFHNDTKDRMRRLFGAQPLLQEESWQDSSGHPDQAQRRRKSNELCGADDMVHLFPPDDSDPMAHLTPEQRRSMQDLEAHELDEHVADAWKDESTDEEPAPADVEQRLKSQRVSRVSRVSTLPRWLDKSEEDVPLAELVGTPNQDGDARALASMLPNADLLAEKEATIRRLEEENRQVRMLLQMRTSMPPMPPMPLQPWMLPIGGMVPPPSAPMTGSIMAPHSAFAPVPSSPEDMPLLQEDQQVVVNWLSDRQGPDT
ncbi:hypothetical protein MNAN1_000917 [Malassezia nana]|uniref:Uncharacterized protein n=1 Tax=Malassezia nana TaxID=180528 RepID=A0AAF0J1H8_9BASI|nr:hypothetical protein MNAN1_000917 [Malassezia nana]